ncbi:MAG TPA: hypothetical protein VMV74_05195 [Bacteroidales bacterium]|nr:hypothetical protein [Bacteroidales bacterium]
MQTERWSVRSGEGQTRTMIFPLGFPFSAISKASPGLHVAVRAAMSSEAASSKSNVEKYL